MKYKLAINMCYFNAIHLGGKDETAFNLLMGFEKNGVSKEIICLCGKNMVPAIKRYAPNVQICVIPQVYFGGIKVKGMNRANRIIRKYFERYWVEKNKDKIAAFLMPNKQTSPWKYDVPTIVIPHDIQVFEWGENAGVKIYRKKL